MISEGNVGLMQALNRFEPEKGFRFATYAMWWIKACIQDYILRSWSLVKIGTTANQKKLFFKLRSAKNRIAAFESGDLRPDQVASIAQSLDVTSQDVIDMNRRLGGDKSINVPVHDDGDAAEWQDYLVDQSPSPEAIVVEQDERERQRKALIAAIDVLDGRERSIFEARFLADEPPTLEEISTKFKVSRERIRQIEARAFEKVRKAAKARASSAPTAMLAISDA
jgi:RNA polymerase sigma-32 factor